MPPIIMGPWANNPKKRAHDVVDTMETVVNDNVKATNKAGNSARNWALQKHGVGALYRGIWVTTYGAEVILAGVQGVGLGMVDTLRLGESLENPSFGTVASDALRVFSVIPAGQVAKGGQVLRIGLAGLVRGGTRSCAVTSTLKATLLSGRKMMTPWFVSMREMMPHGTQVMDALLMGKFPGNYLDDVIMAAGRMGIPFRYSGNGGTLAQIAARAKQLREPIVFVVDLQWANGQWGKHVMTAYAGPGGARFLDQFGDAWRLTADGGLVNTVPSVIGNARSILGFSASEIGAVGARYILPEARTLAALRHVESAARIGQILNNTPHEAAGAISGLNVPIYWVHPKLARYAEAVARKATGRVRPKFPWEHQARPKSGPFMLPPPIKDRNMVKVLRLKEERPEGGSFDAGPVYTYKIRKGDTLFGVANRIYGSASAYVYLTGANPTLTDGVRPSAQLPEGEWLVIPGWLPD